mgnify:CR=1 FL=1
MSEKYKREINFAEFYQSLSNEEKRVIEELLKQKYCQEEVVHLESSLKNFMGSPEIKAYPPVPDKVIIDENGKMYFGAEIRETSPRAECIPEEGNYNDWVLLLNSPEREIAEYRHLEKVKKYLRREIHEKVKRIREEIKNIKEPISGGIPVDGLWDLVINIGLNLIKDDLNWINNDEDGLYTYSILKEYAREKIERRETSPELEDAIQSMREYFEHRRKYFEGVKEIYPPHKLQEFDPFLERRIEQLNEFIEELDTLRRELRRE